MTKDTPRFKTVVAESRLPRMIVQSLLFVKTENRISVDDITGETGLPCPDASNKAPLFVRYRDGVLQFYLVLTEDERSMIPNHTPEIITLERLQFSNILQHLVRMN